MEELMKESSSALGYTPPTIRQLVIALQNNLSESFDQDHDENDYVNISWLVVVLQSHLDLVLMCWLPSWWHWWHIFVGPSFHDSVFVRFPMALDRIIRGQGIHIWFHLCHIWLHLCHIWLHPCTWVIFGSTAWTVALNLGQRGSRQGKPRGEQEISWQRILDKWHRRSPGSPTRPREAGGWASLHEEVVARLKISL